MQNVLVREPVLGAAVMSYEHLAIARPRVQLSPMRDLQERYDAALEEIEMLRHKLGIAANSDRLHQLQSCFHLTGREGKLLCLLYDKGGAVASKEGVMDALYGGMDEPEIKIVDVFVCKVRAKIGGDKIETIWGQGYKLTKAGAEMCERAFRGEIDAKPRQRWDDGVNTVLGLLDKAPRTLLDLAKTTGKAKTQITTALDYAVKRGLVANTGRKWVNNRWYSLYELTPAGKVRAAA